MDNKNDWEELEKWNTQRIIDEKEKSKFYYDGFEKKQKIDIFAKILKIFGWILKIVSYIIILIGIIMGMEILIARIASKL